MNNRHRARRPWLLLWSAFIVHHSSFIIPARAAPPPFYEPKEHYHKAQGRGVEVRWEADRTDLPEDGELTATLVITGTLIDPQQIVRPDLKKLPEFDSRFQVVDVPGKPVPTDAKEVRFKYRLRPRDRAVDRLPSLPFIYFNPDAPEARRFMTIKAAGLDLRVTAAAPTPQPAAVPLDAPEHLFHIETGPRVLGREPFAPCWGMWAALIVGGSLLAGVWFVAWRRLYPDAARLARLRRSRAARRAADAIRRAGRTPDPAGAVAAAVIGYLRSRYPLGPGADTPTDIGRELRAAGLAEADAEDVVAFFRRCDEARFAPAGEGGPLAADALALVTRLEAAA
jgi:hypothetical protein